MESARAASRAVSRICCCGMLGSGLMGLIAGDGGAMLNCLVGVE